MGKISESTPVSISIVMAIIGLAYWAGSLSVRVAQAESAAAVLERKHEEAVGELRAISHELSRISGILETISKRRKHE